jgi:hypothetical protein
MLRDFGQGDRESADGGRHFLCVRRGNETRLTPLVTVS